ncbi:TPA: O-antigen ligase family protein [Vibrio parahaemolyticus]|nr:O-antigen ligase family protein [Vibrio parahaemolyticus]HCG7350107.1 O-antigen ligase family protein [Vibrio parahaemolyticus]
MYLKSKYLFLASVFFLPVQNFGLDLGLMTLKPSQLFVLLFIFCSFKEKIVKVSNSQKLALIMLFLTFLSLITSSFFALDLERSLVLSFAFFLCVLFYLASCIFFNNNVDAFELLKKTLCISGTIFSLYGLLQLTLHFLGLGGNVNFNAWDVIPRVPYFSSENVHASFALIVSILCLSDTLTKRKVRLVLLTIINISGLVATGTRGAMLSFFIAALVLALVSVFDRKSSKLLLIVMVLCILLLVIEFWDMLFLRFESLAEGDDGTTRVRFEHYAIMLDYFSNQPIFGIGLGGSQSLGYQDIHNLFLMIMVEGGILAFVFFLATILFSFFFHIKKRIPRLNVSNLTIIAVFLGVFIQALFEPSLYFYHVYFPLSMLLIKTSSRNVN